jgi:hypothetical protein
MKRELGSDESTNPHHQAVRAPRQRDCRRPRRGAPESEGDSDSEDEEPLFLDEFGTNRFFVPQRGLEEFEDNLFGEDGDSV